eukprot:CAMPEP_0184492558 /NCGR_PEP_ID=MMETSP0113_2-20130426/23635_1 /TAXON_ID=91329 /ORGANISM="Norrisiella sphaerica, Strain BC52" /LENGTH=464 /DNA_ID=CAMNT_0026877427 /DNA_START=1 /DNA_END=1395 /DNA_ORIENTATION=+
MNTSYEVFLFSLGRKISSKGARARVQTQERVRNQPRPRSLHRSRNLLGRGGICSGSVAISPHEIRSEWVQNAFKTIYRLDQRESTTPMLQLQDFHGGTPSFSKGDNGIDLYIKNEAAHLSGSLKHRLARSLFIYALATGKLREKMTVVEASSGSTAISEAWFARRLGLKYISVVAANTSHDKIEAIESLGGQCVVVDSTSKIYDKCDEIVKYLNGKAQQSGEDVGGAYYMDQFTNAEAATDWRGNNNLATEIFQQLEKERFPEPSWIVVGAGTGGTATTIGRYLGYHQRLDTRLCVVDPEDSVFFDCYTTGDRTVRLSSGSSKIEGIGRPRVEPSFRPEVIDRMHRVPDSASLAAMHFLRKLLGPTGQVPGASTGTNLYGSILLIDEMRRQGKGAASLVTLLCDDGRRYEDTYYNNAWLEKEGFEIGPYLDQIKEFWESGILRKLESPRSYSTPSWAHIPLSSL